MAFKWAIAADTVIFTAGVGCALYFGLRGLGPDVSRAGASIERGMLALAQAHERGLVAQALAHERRLVGLMESGQHLESGPTGMGKSIEEGTKSVGSKAA
jgi:hypothetical protein